MRWPGRLDAKAGFVAWFAQASSLQRGQSVCLFAAAAAGKPHRDVMLVVVDEDDCFEERQGARSCCRVVACVAAATSTVEELCLLSSDVQYCSAAVRRDRSSGHYHHHHHHWRRFCCPSVNCPKGGCAFERIRQVHFATTAATATSADGLDVERWVEGGADGALIDGSNESDEPSWLAEPILVQTRPDLLGCVASERACRSDVRELTLSSRSLARRRLLTPEVVLPVATGPVETFPRRSARRNTIAGRLCAVSMTGR